MKAIVQKDRKFRYSGRIAASVVFTDEEGEALRKACYRPSGPDVEAILARSDTGSKTKM
jgi:hypothetical protein